MNYVFDSSSLIYLGKIRLLEKIGVLNGKKFIPQEVYEEVVKKGFERKEPEAEYVEKLIKDKIFLVKEGNKKEIDAFENISLLSNADKEVLALAREEKAIAVIDELYASDVAEFYEIESHGSIYLILLLVKQKIVSRKEAVKYIDEMMRQGFYLSTEKYKEILDKLERL